MASLTYTSKVNNQGGIGTSPYGPALQNKISPSPLKPKRNIMGPGGLWDEKFRPNSFAEYQAKNAPVQGPIQTTQTTQPYATIKTSSPKPSTGITLTSQQQADNKAYLSGAKTSTPPTPPTPITPPTPQKLNEGYEIKAPTDYKGMVTGLADQGGSQYNKAIGTSIGGLQGIADKPNVGANLSKDILHGIMLNQTKGVTDAQKDYNKFAQSSPYMLAAQSNPNVAADIASGRSSLLGQTFSNILGAKQQAVQNALSGQGQQITAGQAAGGLALDAQGQQITAGQAAGGLGLSGQQTAQSALGTAAGFAAPQPYGLTTQPYNPVEDTYGGGGAGGAINRGVQAQNIQTAQDFTKNIQNLEAMSSSADANFDILNSFATGAKTSLNSPIIDEIKRIYGSSVQGNPQLAGFLSQLQAIRAAYTEIVGGDAVQAIPDNITPAQLKKVQESLKSTAQNKAEGYKKGLSELGGQNQSNQSSEALTWDTI